MVKNASAGEKAGWFNGRTPLFSQKDLYFSGDVRQAFARLTAE